VSWPSLTISANLAARTVLKTRGRSDRWQDVFWRKAYTPIESGHPPGSFRLAFKKAEIENFHFHDLRQMFANDARAEWHRSLQGAPVAGAQIVLHDAAICANFTENLRDGVEMSGQRLGNAQKAAQSAGLDEEAVCVGS